VGACEKQLDPPPAACTEDDCSFLDFEEAGLLRVACQELAVPDSDTRNLALSYAARPPMFGSLGSCHDGQFGGLAFHEYVAAASQLAVAAEQSGAAAARPCELDGADDQEVALTTQTVAQTLYMLGEV